MCNHHFQFECIFPSTVAFLSVQDVILIMPLQYLENVEREKEYIDIGHTCK